MKTHEKIRQLREMRQWTQEEMANKLSMSITGYAKIERGDTHSNLMRLEQISDVFGMDIIELLSFGEDKAIQLNNQVNNTFSNSYNSVLFGENDAKVEVEKLLLMLSHKEEIIKQLEKENALLMEMNNLLKEKS